MLLDHLVLRHRAELIFVRTDRVDEAHALGAALAEHVRREERVLFPLIERSLSRDKLDRVADRLDHATLRSTRRTGENAVESGALDRSAGLSFGPLPGPGNSDGGWAPASGRRAVPIDAKRRNRRGVARAVGTVAIVVANQ